jgi:peptidoglycan/LPS O-acetylase OafA/YrhL
MKYIKQLDSIRAVAVVLVIISHWIPAKYIINRIPNGAIGVDIFFVLSGFLISSILFENKKKSEQDNISKFVVLRIFYIRRSLRIFPIYYLTIIILFFFSEFVNCNIKNNFFYYATYTCNFHYFFNNNWDGITSHLWSLAVEEQFYLIWPFIILFSNNKYHFNLIMIFIFIGILSQKLLSDFNMGNVLPFTCFDSFGFGALLAWQKKYAKEKEKRFQFWLVTLASIATLSLILEIVTNKSILFPQRTIISIYAVILISYIVKNHQNENLKFKIILNNKILIFLGKISYGLYLFQNIIPSTINSKIINVYFNPLLPDILFKTYWSQLYLIENVIILISISWLSYIFIEKKFLKLKDSFEIG